MDYKSFIVDKDIIVEANKVCQYIDNKDLKNIAIANHLGFELALEYFKNEGYDVQQGICCSDKIISDLNISDIYVNGNYVDVRLYFNDNELCIPTKALKYGIKPVAFMFIKMNTELTEATLTGFIQADDINIENTDKDYCLIPSEKFVSLDEISQFLTIDSEISLPENFKQQIFDYVDNKMAGTKEFYDALIHSAEARRIFINSTCAKNMLANLPSDINIDTQQNLNENVPEEISLNNGETNSEMDFLSDFDNDNNNDNDNDSLLTPNNSSDSDLLTLDSNNIQDEFDFSDDSGMITLDEGVEENIPMQTIEDISEINNKSDDFEQNTLTEDNSDTDFDLSEIVMTGMDEEQEEVSVENDVIDTISEDEQNINQTGQAKTIDEFPQEILIKEENEIDEIAESVSELYNQVPTPVESKIEDDIQEMYESKNLEQDDSSKTQVTPNLEIVDNMYSDSIPNMNENLEYNQGNVVQKKSSATPLLLLLFVVLLAGGGFYAYNKMQTNNVVSDNVQQADVVTQENKIENEQNVMPVETVEDTTPKETGEIGNNIEVPEIEKNLDTSILVSNLSVSWEVPQNCLSNKSVQNTLNRLGRIIQLNLKSELLLLDRPPITNKIAVEILCNDTGFQTNGVTVSSGEKTVDELILRTVKQVLDKKHNINMEIFKGIKGSMTLVVHL